MSDSLRILVVGEQWFGATPRGVADGLRTAGHEVETVDADASVPKAMGMPLKVMRRVLQSVFVADYNRRLVAVAQHFRPDFVLVVKGPFVHRDSVRVWREAGAAVYNYYPDVSVFAFGRHIPQALPEYDHVFTTKSFQLAALRERLGADRVTFLPHGYSAEVHRPLGLSVREREDLGTEVGYIGNYSPHKERFLAGLRDRLPDVGFAVRGNHWESECQSPQLRPCLRGPAVSGWGYAKIIAATRINVAIHSGIVDGEGTEDLMSTRSFEIPACGGFMLHERNAETEGFFVDGVEAGLFADVDEAAAQARRFLADEAARLRVATAGHRRCVPAYSYGRRMETIVEHHQQHGRAVLA